MQHNPITELIRIKSIISLQTFKSIVLISTANQVANDLVCHSGQIDLVRNQKT